jgi:RecA/RadA recombinase
MKAGVPDMTQAQRNAAARAGVKKINESFKGAPVVVPASEANSNAFLRRPCGVMQLDIDCGGGLPAASFCTIAGPDNAGKSTLLYYYFAQHQRLYGDDAYCALVCSEATVDYFQARRCGWIIPVPLKMIEDENRSRKQQGLPEFTKEEVADLRREVGVNYLVTGLTTAEEMLDVLEKMLDSNLYGIVGLDSFEGLMPNAEATLDSLEDYPQQAARASAITRFLQHYGPIARRPEHFTTFIMTCQVRVNRKKGEAQAHIQKYLKDWMEVVPPSVKHWRKIGISVFSGAKITEKAEKFDANNKAIKEGKVALGKEVNWELSKGKDNSHDNIVGATNYFYDARCFDIQRTVLHAGIRYGVIREHEGRLTFYKNGEQHEYLCNIDGPDMFVQALQEEPAAEWELRQSILHAAHKDCLYV